MCIYTSLILRSHIFTFLPSTHMKTDLWFEVPELLYYNYTFVFVSAFGVPA